MNLKRIFNPWAELRKQDSIIKQQMGIIEQMSGTKFVAYAASPPASAEVVKSWDKGIKNDIRQMLVVAKKWRDDAKKLHKKNQ